MQAKIYCERTYNLSARLIHAGMWLFQIVRFKKPEKVYNHWGILVNDENWEAVAEGVVNTNRILHDESLLFPVELTDEAYQYLTEQKGKRYEYSNFLFHALRIIFPQWFGSKTDDRHSCVELVSRVLIKSDWDISEYSNPVELKEFLKSQFEQ